MSDLSQSNTGTRRAAAVLAAAIEELELRERKLMAYEGELREVRDALKALRKAVGGDSSSTSPAPGAPKGETKTEILRVCREADGPLDRDAIAEAMGRKPAGWLSMQLEQMVRRGELEHVDGYGYAVPAPAAVTPIKAGAGTPFDQAVARAGR